MMKKIFPIILFLLGLFPFFSYAEDCPINIVYEGKALGICENADFKYGSEFYPYSILKCPDGKTCFIRQCSAFGGVCTIKGTGNSVSNVPKCPDEKVFPAEGSGSDVFWPMMCENSWTKVCCLDSTLENADCLNKKVGDDCTIGGPNGPKGKCLKNEEGRLECMDDDFRQEGFACGAGNSGTCVKTINENNGCKKGYIAASGGKSCAKGLTCCRKDNLCQKMGGKCYISGEQPKGYIVYQDGNNSCEGEQKCYISPGTLSAEFEYENPLEVDSFTEWIQELLGNLQVVVGWLAVIMIVVGGVIYIISTGNQSMVTLAKNIIIWALVGFAVAVGAPTLLKEIKEITSTGGGEAADIIDKANTFKRVLSNILRFLFSFIGVMALIGFVTGGFMYLLSAGDSQKSETAKKMIGYSIIAVAVASAGLIILKQVMSLMMAGS